MRTGRYQLVCFSTTTRPWPGRCAFSSRMAGAARRRNDGRGLL